MKPEYPTYQEPLTVHPNLKRFAAFGHGRRICPGLEVSEKALFLQTTSLYWACRVVKAKDGARGDEIPVPWYDYTGVTISTPRPFRFVMEEKVNGRLAMMEEAAKGEHVTEMAID